MLFYNLHTFGIAQVYSSLDKIDNCLVIMYVFASWYATIDKVRFSDQCRL